MRYIAEAVASGQLSGNGPFTRRCQELLQWELGAAQVLLTTSCTHALEMAALLLDIREGDEIICPSFTFVSTANAFVLRGARPVFADIRPDTLNLDEKNLSALITPRTKVLVVVHYAGVGCEMDALVAVARERGIPIVEDNACGLFGSYRGKYLGAFGDLATLSFHETKNVICGEGGALIINDPQYIRRAEIIREKGTNRSRFFRGELDKYTWVDAGSSYLPSELQAAFLCAQLECRKEIDAARSAIWRRYQEGLTEWAHCHGVQLPFVPHYCVQSHHMFYLLLPSEEAREELIRYLKIRGILAVFHYVPLHLSEMGLRYGGYPGQCPVTEDVSDRLVRLPFYNALSEIEQAEIVQALTSFEVPRQPVRREAIASNP